MERSFWHGAGIMMAGTQGFGFAGSVSPHIRKGEEGGEGEAEEDGIPEDGVMGHHSRGVSSEVFSMW